MSKIKKILFFDIDGTLMNPADRKVPESAINALKMARDSGHLVFINSGRVRIGVDEVADLVEVDGFVCGCGTYVQVGDQVLYHYDIPEDRRSFIKNEILKFGFDGVLEGMDGIIIRNKVSHIPAMEELRQTLIRHMPQLCWEWENDSYSFDKACIIGDGNSDLAGLTDSLKRDFELIDRGRQFYECVPVGHSKASGIEVVLKHYGIPLEQAYVFGDSMNDLAMFEYVPNAILMGNHDQELKAHASFITKPVEQDGIAYALEQLGII